MAAIARACRSRKLLIIRECREKKELVHGPHVEAFEAEFAQFLWQRTRAHGVDRVRPHGPAFHPEVAAIFPGLGNHRPRTDVLGGAEIWSRRPEACVRGHRSVDVHDRSKAVERYYANTARFCRRISTGWRATWTDHGHREATQPQGDRRLCALAWRHAWGRWSERMATRVSSASRPSAAQHGPVADSPDA